VKNRSNFAGKRATLCVVVSLFGPGAALAQTAQRYNNVDPDALPGFGVL
jgi:hypothetical protein